MQFFSINASAHACSINRTFAADWLSSAKVKLGQNFSAKKKKTGINKHWNKIIKEKKKGICFWEDDALARTSPCN